MVERNRPYDSVGKTSRWIIAEADDNIFLEVLAPRRRMDFGSLSLSIRLRVLARASCQFNRECNHV